MDADNGSESEFLAKSAVSSLLGKATELLVASSCILSSRGRLSVSTTLVDDDGVDLVFHLRGRTATLAVQVKSRMDDGASFAKGRFQATVRSQTFRARDNLALVFVPVELGDGSFRTAWLVPSRDFHRLASFDSLKRLRFVAATSPISKDKWAQYRVTRSELAVKIEETLNALETD